MKKFPKWVKNNESYQNYLDSKQMLETHPERQVVCPNGCIINIDYPLFHQAAIRNGMKEEDLQNYADKRKYFRNLLATISNLKRQSSIPPEGDENQKAPFKIIDIENYKTEILELFSRWFSPAQVHKELTKKGINIRYKDIDVFYKSNKELIREHRNKISEDYDDLPIGVKRSRLEKLNLLLNYFLNEFEKDGSKIKDNIEVSKEMRALLDQARKEVEGDELKLTINGRIDIEQTINVIMKNSVIMQDLTLQMIVMAKVCMRTGIPFLKMVHRMANSFYAKYNGFRYADNLNDKPVYPSSVQYDILDMGPKYDEWKRLQNIEDVKYAEIPPSGQEIDKSELFRSQLLERLSHSKERVSRIVDEYGS